MTQSTPDRPWCRVCWRCHRGVTCSAYIAICRVSTVVPLPACLLATTHTSAGSCGMCAYAAPARTQSGPKAAAQTLRVTKCTHRDSVAVALVNDPSVSSHQPTENLLPSAVWG